MRKIDTNDVDLREAMWGCYGRKCFYSRRPILYDDMELDHIVSQKDRSPEELRDLLRRLGKNENFEIDSVYNLVPCHRTENKRKGGRENINGMLLWLQEAEDMAPRIIAEINRLKKVTQGRKKLIRVKSLVQKGHETPENVYDFLAEEKYDFPEKREEVNGGAFYHSTKNILLNGTLPQYPSLSGSCCIVFRSLRIRDCIIDLSHRDILRYFYKGMYTDPSLGIRRFIKATAYNDTNKYWVQFNNVTILLNSHELTQLCNIVDDYATEYLNALKYIDKYLGSEEMMLSRDLKGGYRLLKVDLQLWDKLVEFTTEHDYDEGKTDWHMFDANRFKIKVCSRDNNVRYDCGYHAILEPEKEINNYGSNNEVWIVWSPYVQASEAERFSPRGCWNPKEALRWLREEFIPYVYSYYSQLHIYELKEYLCCEYFKECNDIENITNNKQLASIVDELQAFFSTTEKSFVKGMDFKSLKLALRECLIKVPLRDYRYIAGNLGYEGLITLDAILYNLEKEACFVTDQVEGSNVIDLHMRCIAFALDEYPLNRENIDIALILNLLEPFIEYKKMQDLVQKYEILE